MAKNTKQVGESKANKKAKVEENKVVHMSPLNEDLKLNCLDEQLVYNVMATPSKSRSEYRIQTFIILWAKENGVEYDVDEKGNIYLTKGVVKKDEYYPCVTAHMDTVQEPQTVYAKAGLSLDVLTRVKNGKHEIYCDGFGIGGDDKAGVAICLNMFRFFKTIKACFFVEEEVGCLGSKVIDMKKDFYKEWFGNVGYVIGYDSPDLNRAAHTCSGTKLMGKEFFEKNGLAELCAKYGLNDFRSEPYTDVKSIREATDIICMNFGTGYYNCHLANEYCVLEDMDNALEMGKAIIEKLGKTEHKMKCVGGGYGVSDADTMYFNKLNPSYKETYTYTGNAWNGGYGEVDDEYDFNGYNGYTSNTKKTDKTDKDAVKPEIVEYVVDAYEKHINNLKDAVVAKCKELGIDEAQFVEIFSKEIKF